MGVDDGIKILNTQVFIKTIFRFLDCLQITLFAVQCLQIQVILIMCFSIIVESSLIKTKIQSRLLMNSFGIYGTNSPGLLYSISFVLRAIVLFPPVFFQQPSYCGIMAYKNLNNTNRENNFFHLEWKSPMGKMTLLLQIDLKGYTVLSGYCKPKNSCSRLACKGAFAVSLQGFGRDCKLAQQCWLH